MNPSSPVTHECIDHDRSVIVVSDLHLGGTEDPGTSARFGRFLTYLQGLFPANEGSGSPEPGNPALLPPQKFILLGDVFDLWDPRCQDRNAILLDAIIPIARIGDLDCDVIFVTGNHDENLMELIDLHVKMEGHGAEDPCRNDPDPCEEATGKSVTYIPPVNEESKDSGLEFRTSQDRTFSLYKRSYIPGAMKEGLEVGGVHYAFLHGHQFDPEQLTYRVSAFLKQRFDPVSYIMDYADTGLSKLIPVQAHFALLALWIVMFLGTRWGLIGGSLLAALFWILTFIIVVLSLPRIFAFLKRAFYNRVKARDKTVDEIVGKEDTNQRKYFRPEKFTIGADVVVFGHTHCAGKKRHIIPAIGRNPKAGKQFYLLNSGGWVRVKPGKPDPTTPKDPCKDHLDTFIYLDREGATLMKWVEEREGDGPCTGRVRTIAHLPGSVLLSGKEE